MCCSKKFLLETTLTTFRLFVRFFCLRSQFRVFMVWHFFHARTSFLIFDCFFLREEEEEEENHR